MNLKDIATLSVPLFRAGQNIGLIGSPGIGKTELVGQLVSNLKASDIWSDRAVKGDDKRGVRFIPVAATTIESVDVNGLMGIEDGYTVWHPSRLIPRGDEPSVVFIDEFPQAELPVQLALQKWIDRSLNGVDVSTRSLFVVAGNRPEDNAGVNEMPQHLRNRFAWFDVTVDDEVWREWAEKHDVHHDIIDFIKFKPESLNTFRADSESNTYATPRSVTRLSSVLRHAHVDQWVTLAASICGSTWAAEFEQYRQICASLPDMDNLMANPDSTPIPSEFGPLFALSSSVVRRVQADKSHSESALTVVSRICDVGYEEIAAKSLRDLRSVNPGIFNANGAVGVAKKLRALID